MASGGLPGPPLHELAGAAAAHLSPQDFHALLERSSDEAVLLDVRNLYETRVGRFSRVTHIPICHPCSAQQAQNCRPEFHHTSTRRMCRRVYRVHTTLFARPCDLVCGSERG